MLLITVVSIKQKRISERLGTPIKTSEKQETIWLGYCKNRDVEESIAMAESVTTVHPLYATGWDTLGNPCLLAKDWTCARSAFDQALSIAPYRVDTHANLGSLYYLQEDWKQAMYWWTQTLTLNPNHTYAQQGLQAIHKITAGDHPIEP